LPEYIALEVLDKSEQLKWIESAGAGVEAHAAAKENVI
jgi:hypothetical protein